MRPSVRFKSFNNRTIYDYRITTAIGFWRWHSLSRTFQPPESRADISLRGSRTVRTSDTGDVYVAGTCYSLSTRSEVRFKS